MHAFNEIGLDEFAHKICGCGARICGALDFAWRKNLQAHRVLTHRYTMPDYLRRFRKRRFKLTFDIQNFKSLTKIKDFLASFIGVYRIVLTAAMEGLMGAPSIMMIYPG